MGVPPSSVNCFEDASFFVLALGADVMRVPRPAAGMMTTTFMRAQVYGQLREEFKSGQGGWGVLEVNERDWDVTPIDAHRSGKLPAPNCNFRREGDSSDVIRCSYQTFRGTISLRHHARRMARIRSIRPRDAPSRGSSH